VVAVEAEAQDRIVKLAVVVAQVVTDRLLRESLLVLIVGLRVL
jgi:hypothetical protein